MDNPIEDFAFLPYSGDVVKKSELVNYKVGEEAIFTDYELNGLFIGGLLDFTNNTTHDLWLKDNEKIAKLVEWSVKSLNDLNMSEEPQIEKKEEVQEEFIEVKETSAEEGVENEGENPAKKSEGESNKNPIKDSLEVVPLDEIISATETEAETNSSSISRSASTASDLSEHCKFLVRLLKKCLFIAMFTFHIQPSLISIQSWRTCKRR